MFYNARWYDPGINQFTQPDTLIPNLYNPLDWNRYSYARYNPVFYNDPTGHFPWGPILKIVQIVVVVVAVAAVVTMIDTAIRGHATTTDTCSSTYATCFENGNRLNLTENQQLDEKQFDDMMHSIHDDLEGGWRTPLDPGRQSYDTPFWDGNPRFGKAIYNDQTVCLSDKCSPRSAVNYVGEGMYSARTGEPLFLAKLIAHTWNLVAWRHRASPDELYWLEYGYDAYNDIEEEKSEDSP